MEQIAEKSLTQTIPRDKKNANAPPADQNGLPLPKKRKRNAPMQLLRAALYVFRFRPRKSKSKSLQVDLVSKLSLKGLVGSMRPMHLQSNQSLTPAIEPKPVTTIMPEQDSVPILVGGNIEEAHMPSSLSPMTDRSPSPVFSMSSYGSASDMSQLCESPLNLLPEFHRVRSCEEIAQEEFWYDDDGGDEMIDAKAEEFIAQFYQQMRLQDN